MLVLEHRLRINMTQAIVDTNSKMARQYSHGRDENYLVDTIFPLLFLHGGGFKQLKKIFLYAVFIEDQSSLESKDKPMDFCRQSAVQCEGRFGTVCEFEEHNGVAEWLNKEDADWIN